MREKEGNLQSVVKSTKPTTEESVFKLKQKGQIPELQSNPKQETQAMSNGIQRQETAKDKKLGECEIEKSLKQRMKEGSMTSTIPKQNKVEEEVYNLKLNGSIPILSEPKELEQCVE